MLVVRLSLKDPDRHRQLFQTFDCLLNVTLPEFRLNKLSPSHWILSILRFSIGFATERVRRLLLLFGHSTKSSVNQEGEHQIDDNHFKYIGLFKPNTSQSIHNSPAANANIKKA